MFNLMFKTFMGPVEDEASVVYLRPETAQGIFVNFENVLNTTRKKLPFGIAQIGKSFRNEITTGNFIFRSREFEQMEMEFFVKPGTDEEWFEYWVEERLNWYVKLGIKKENLQPAPARQGGAGALCPRLLRHRVPLPDGLGGAGGHRQPRRLRPDAALPSSAARAWTTSTRRPRSTIIPYVIEPSAGVDRSVLAFLCDAYDEEPDKDEIRVVLHFHPAIAPIKVAVLPLSRKENLVALARDVYNAGTTRRSQNLRAVR